MSDAAPELFRQEYDLRHPLDSSRSWETTAQGATRVIHANGLIQRNAGLFRWAQGLRPTGYPRLGALMAPELPR
jgi:hypothetical protein